MYLVRFFNFKNESVSETTFSTGDVELQRSFLNKLFKIFLEIDKPLNKIQFNNRKKNNKQSTSTQMRISSI